MFIEVNYKFISNHPIAKYTQYMDQATCESFSEAFISHFYITHKNSQQVLFSHIFPGPVGMSHLFYLLLFWVSI